MKLSLQLCFLFAIVTFTGITLKAQVLNSSSFVVKGKVLNASEKKWELATTSFFDKQHFQVPVSADGTFNASIPIDSIQNVDLYLNNKAIPIYAYSGDTIELNWDAKDFKNTFTIESPIPDRHRDLQTNIKIYHEFDESTSSLNQKLYMERNAHDSLKYSWVNEHFNKQLKFILEDTTHFTSTTRNFILDAYYSHINLLLSYNLSNLSLLKPDRSYVNPNNSAEIGTHLNIMPDYKGLSYSDFCISPAYRDFIYNYCQSDKPFTYTIDYARASHPEEFISGSSVKDAYYRALANIKVYTIRDWVATKIITSGFSFAPFNECESVLNDFLTICKTEPFKDSLSTFYDSVKKFASGQPAPDFTLKDENGKYVSLSSFKGNVVHIDFWGVGCAPCRFDISNFVPQLHEKYHEKDVVFINICIDSDEETWKKAIADLKLEGVNLFAEGGTSNPVWSLYNVLAVPHYMVLDKEGRFVAYNAARGGQFLPDNIKNIDKALGME